MICFLWTIFTFKIQFYTFFVATRAFQTKRQLIEWGQIHRDGKEGGCRYLRYVSQEEGGSSVPRDKLTDHCPSLVIGY